MVVVDAVLIAKIDAVLFLVIKVVVEAKHQ